MKNSNRISKALNELDYLEDILRRDTKMTMLELFIQFVKEHELIKVSEYYTEEVYYDRDTKIFYEIKDEYDGFAFAEVNKENSKYPTYYREFIAKDEVINFLDENLKSIVCEDCIKDIIDELIDDVIEDLRVSADMNFNDDDIRLSVGRVLVDKFHYLHNIKKGNRLSF